MAGRRNPRDPHGRSVYAASWREDIKSRGGCVTNVAFSPAAWQRVKDVQGGSTTRGASSKAISDLFERSVVIDEATLGQAGEILREFPDMGTLEEVLRVCVGHLLMKIKEDYGYIVTSS